MSIQQQQDKRLTRQIEGWVNEMIRVTPIKEWGNALARLLVDWANKYGVIFTKESLDAVQHWMAREQDLALQDRELAEGRRFHAAIQEAAKAEAEEQGIETESGTVHFECDLSTGDFVLWDVSDVDDQQQHGHTGNGPTNAVAQSGSQESESARRYGRGVHAYFDGNYGQAMEHLNIAIGLGTDDPRMHYFRGLVFLKQGDRAAAVMEFDHGAALEFANGSFRVGTSLQRIQGPARRLLEQYRRQGRRAALRWKVMFVLENSPQFVYLRNDPSSRALEFKKTFYATIARFNDACLTLWHAASHALSVFLPRRISAGG